MKITIKDYLKTHVAGPNKCIIKVNGVTLKNGTMYSTITQLMEC
ncbi:hypothetical protein [Methanosphaera sp. BMS]|nr:hypothetical protein [Methanosphaera sp. BMS]